MTPLSALWLPIVLSAVIVFVASSIMHMVLPYHRTDYQKLPDEDKVLPALRAAGLKRGLYIFPFATHKDMKSPALVEKYKQGPVGMMTIFPSGPPVMPKFLGLWFGYCLIIGFFVAYLTAHTVVPGAYYLARLPRRGDCRVPCLRTGKHQQQHLERTDLEHDDQRSDRWTRLRPADRGNLRLALASVTDHPRSLVTRERDSAHCQRPCPGSSSSCARRAILWPFPAGS